MRGLVTGLGWVTAAGMGTGRGKLSFSRPAGTIPAIRRSDVMPEPDQRFGRLDVLSRVGLAAAARALEDAGLRDGEGKRPGGMIVEGRHGSLQTDLAYWATVVPGSEKLASPNLFAYTLPSTLPGEAAIRFGLTGPAFALATPEADGRQALVMALELLADGEVPFVLAGTCDLDAPPPFASPGEVPPGALLVVLEASSRPPRAAYGTLVADGGLLLFENRTVADLAHLAALCGGTTPSDPPATETRR